MSCKEDEGREVMSEAEFFGEQVNEFLHYASGVIHVGANIGQEAEMYHCLELPVIWIEPLASAYEELTERIKQFPGQCALPYLLTDKDGEEIDFHVSGQSSSILPLKLHKQV